MNFSKNSAREIWRYSVEFLDGYKKETEDKISTRDFEPHVLFHNFTDTKIR